MGGKIEPGGTEWGGLTGSNIYWRAAGGELILLVQIAVIAAYSFELFFFFLQYSTVLVEIEMFEL